MSEPAIPAVLRPLDLLGGWGISIVASLGRFGTFLLAALGAMVTPPLKFWAFVDRINFIGFRSLLIILLTGAFTGMVLGLQIFFTLSRFGSEAFLGPAVALSLIRELGPVLAALMVRAARARRSPPSSASCASPSRSTRWRSWPSVPCATWWRRRSSPASSPSR